MLLQGSISRFNLADVLQFLALSAATGVLEVRDFEEYGFIYLVNGRVEGISLPLTDERLGTSLVKTGHLSGEQLADTLMEEAALTPDQRRLKPLGQRLVERGLTCETAVREVLDRQILDQVFELAHWQEGVFVYSEPEQMPRFEVAIQRDVQELLLEVQRRIDEGEGVRKTGSSTDHEVCYACPLSLECTPALKAKYLKQDVCLWRRLDTTVNDEFGTLEDARRFVRSSEEGAAPALEAAIDS